MEPKKAEEKIESFLVDYFWKAGKKKAVVGLSGGLDSAVTLALCVRALGRKNTLAVLLPSSSTPKRDVADARRLARQLGARAISISISPILRSFGPLASSRLSRANLSARVRMGILYAIAGRENGLVVGTGDKSECLLGYFTKYGDGGADLFPLGGLYKTEVKRLASHLGIPQQIISKPASPALWKGQTAEGELGFSYEIADKVLAAMEKGEPKREIERKYGKKLVGAIFKRMEKNLHKLLPAPLCGF